MTDENKKLRVYTQANRLAWNEAARVMGAQRLARLREAFAAPGYSSLDATAAVELGRLGLAGKRVAQLCCHNGTDLLSVLALGAAGGVGFDIAENAIAEARELAAIARADCRFVATDIYDIDTDFDASFDLLLFTIGALCWLPDLPRAFAVAARLLKPGADLVVHEMHPFLMMLPAPGEPAYQDPLRVEYSYFAIEPVTDTEGIDYLGHTKYQGPVKYDFPYRLSDVINAVLAAGLSPATLREYPHDISKLFGHLENDGRVPLSFLLHARKPVAG